MSVPTTAEKLAAEHGVSEKTVRRANCTPCPGAGIGANGERCGCDGGQCEKRSAAAGVEMD